MMIYIDLYLPIVFSNLLKNLQPPALMTEVSLEPLFNYLQKKKVLLHKPEKTDDLKGT